MDPPTDPRRVGGRRAFLLRGGARVAKTVGTLELRAALVILGPFTVRLPARTVPPLAAPLALPGHGRVRRSRCRRDGRGPFHVEQGVPETPHILVFTQDDTEEAFEGETAALDTEVRTHTHTHTSFFVTLALEPGAAHVLD